MEAVLLGACDWESLGLEAMGFRAANGLEEASPRDLSFAIVGAPYANKDGSNRQFEIKLCSPGDQLELRPEPRNRFDEHAVAVVTTRGVQIGFITSERAPLVGSLIRGGHALTSVFQEETPWGAVIRVGIDQAPTLPKRRSDEIAHRTSAADADVGFWPDYDPGFE